MNAEISETIGATILRLGRQIPEIPAHRKFVSARNNHAHSNAHAKTVAPTVLMLELYCSRQYLSIDPRKSLQRSQTAHKLQRIVNMNADISETIKDGEMGF